MHELRSYQMRIAKDACEILQRKNIVCIFAMVRTGKSIMSLETCKLYGAKRELFITKIKAGKIIAVLEKIKIKKYLKAL